jgi:hypothetical protein
MTSSWKNLCSALHLCVSRCASNRQKDLHHCARVQSLKYSTWPNCQISAVVFNKTTDRVVRAVDVFWRLQAVCSCLNELKHLSHYDLLLIMLPLTVLEIFYFASDVLQAHRKVVMLHMC